MLEIAKDDVLNKWLGPRVDAALAKKQAKDEQLRDRAETEEKQGTNLYIDRLFAKTEVLAVASIEPAQTIIEAALGACAGYRQAIGDKALRAGRDPAEDANDIGKTIRLKLDPEVIVTRNHQTP
jgi:hypothetical protein